MPVEVRAVSFPKDTVRFVKTWWPIYKDDPHWVPPLVFERKAFFHPQKNPSYEQATVQPFIAYKDGKAVGTIAACHDVVLEEHIPGMGSFGFFEFIDDVEVARALLEAAKDWLRDRGLQRVMGPYNFSSNHEFALLVDGFDTDPCILNPHNSAYYPGIYAQIGLEPNMTWYAYWMDYGPEPPRIARIAKRLLKRKPNIVIRDVDMSRWDEEIATLREVYNDAWHDNWGHTPISEKEFFHMANQTKDLVATDLCYVVEVDGQPVGVSITYPDYNQLVKKMNGGLFPFGWYHWLFRRRTVNKLRVFILGVKKDFQHLPIGAPMYARTWEAGTVRKVIGAEASLILHNNVGMRGALEKMGAYVYKTYQSFETKLVDDAPDIHSDVGEIVPAKPIGWSLTPEGQAALTDRK